MNKRVQHAKKKLIDQVLVETVDRGRYKINWESNSKIFLKINLGKNQIDYLDREMIALDWLKGLAVPKRVKIPKEKIATISKAEKTSYLAMEWIPWRDCWARKFSTDQAIGVWAFILEQLCAFRRKKILYTDIKPSHFLISDDFMAGTIIDFDGCVMVAPRGIYPLAVFQITPEFSGPETYFAWKHTERIIVYQLGMLLGNLLVGRLKNADLNKSKVNKIKNKLVKNHYRLAWELLERCLSQEPRNRPKDLEALWTEFSKIKMSAHSLQIWNQLRDPYQEKLKSLGLKGPSRSSIKLLLKAS